MNNVLLTDFSKRELQTLLNVVVMRKLTRNPNDSEEKEEFEILQTWHVQILNAIGKVGIQEQISSN